MKLCAATPTCLSGDYNPWQHKCYQHSNLTACNTLRSHPQFVHFSKVPCCESYVYTLFLRIFYTLDSSPYLFRQSCLICCWFLLQHALRQIRSQIHKKLNIELKVLISLQLIRCASPNGEICVDICQLEIAYEFRYLHSAYHTIGTAVVVLNGCQQVVSTGSLLNWMRPQIITVSLTLLLISKPCILTASFASVVHATANPPVCLSVCLSVRHTPVLCQNKERVSVFVPFGHQCRLQFLSVLISLSAPMQSSNKVVSQKVSQIHNTK